MQCKCVHIVQHTLDAAAQRILASTLKGGSRGNKMTIAPKTLACTYLSDNNAFLDNHLHGEGQKRKKESATFTNAHTHQVLVHPSWLSSLGTFLYCTQLDLAYVVSLHKECKQLGKQLTHACTHAHMHAHTYTRTHATALY
eukprot:1152952-Pelagomonas_calceolata.AAC.3